MLKFVLMLAASLATTNVALAQSAATPAGWPDRPLKMVVAFPAGSSTDVVGRIIANELSKRLGQQIITENRSGASGSLGSDVVAKSPPDGYTLGIGTTSTHALGKVLNPKLPYDPVKDFTPVGMIGSSPYILVVTPSLPAKSIKELVALAKSKPGKFNYGSAGPASLANLTAALFATLADIDLTHVPYKSSAQSVTDLISGRLDMQFATMAPTLPNIRANQLRPLAVTSGKRFPAVPEVPTMIESGVPGFESLLWMAFLMPAGTPQPIVDRINRELNDILSKPEMQEKLAAQGLAVEPGPPDAVTKRITGDIDKWRAVATKAGLKTTKQ
jgi:tripartite-type tricarboxylate transporter receptor subunit TctC